MRKGAKEGGAQTRSVGQPFQAAVLAQHCKEGRGRQERSQGQSKQAQVAKAGELGRSGWQPKWDA
eukprot:8158784-Prorocentrum_lima.AAC.1